MHTVVQPLPHDRPSTTTVDNDLRSIRGSLATEGRWIIAAAASGFAISAIGAQLLELGRAWVVLILALTAGLLITAYVRSSGIEVYTIIQHRWWWALIRGVVVGGVLILLLLPDDPSPTPGTAQLAANVLWLGVVYGAAESLLVNVLPMMAAWRALQRAGWTQSWPGKIAASAFAFIANLGVTVAYSLGFPEFRGWEITGPIGSNALIGLGFVLAPNPIISILSHVLLHTAAVLSGTEGPINLPPHY